MNVRLFEVARLELDHAISYYNSQAPALGHAFLLEFVAAVERIGRFPDAWHPLGDEARRCRLRRFPYGLIYAADEKEILILAVAHLHRKPDYWKDRLAK